ncbi:LLM class flavin-dependent oxidoreductase [Plantactinospora sp. GCM10030261]|uniref:LLM class flavin-dependent oxidoreductase n=1 Tax=Plantactinospora sp. GCM10030261 TaxID=3273420 RepID=UPI003615D692
MSDYGHDLLFGTFQTPAAADPARVVATARRAERADLDLVTFQDHPYQPAFLDTWTLLSYVAAATHRIRLTGNVLNLPLRQPVVLARAAASLDRLSGGRVELGLGAGAFWDAIEASGGRRLSPGQAVEALDEAIRIIREVWAADRRGGVRVAGEHYRVAGAKRGPAPAHDIGVWIGAYKPRMLGLVGRVADGWLPSLSYLPGGPADLRDLNARIDDAASAAGRDPTAVRRLLNISGEFTTAGSGPLTGPPAQWVEELAGLALEHGISGFILATDDPDTIDRFGAEVAPAVRELVAADRDRSEPDTASPTADPGVRLSDRHPWDESTRPQAPPAPAGHTYTEIGRSAGQHLIDVHDGLRAELAQVRDLLEQVEQGALSAGEARGQLNRLALRSNDWTLGAFCARYCAVVTQHHSLEDGAIFPHLRRTEPGLAPVLDRLQQEHVVIHEVIEEVDRALVALTQRPGDLTELRKAVDLLSDTLLSHLSYEERSIVEPLSRLGFYPGQL